MDTVKLAKNRIVTRLMRIEDLLNGNYALLASEQKQMMSEVDRQDLYTERNTLYWVLAVAFETTL